MLDLLLIEWVTKMKPGSNSVEEDHPQLSHKRHPVDGTLVGSGSLWPICLSFLLPWTLVHVHFSFGLIHPLPLECVDIHAEHSKYVQFSCMKCKYKE
jgi:hypothetical protein